MKEVLPSKEQMDKLIINETVRVREQGLTIPADTEMDLIDTDKRFVLHLLALAVPKGGDVDDNDKQATITLGGSVHNIVTPSNLLAWVQPGRYLQNDYMFTIWEIVDDAGDENNYLFKLKKEYLPYQGKRLSLTFRNQDSANDLEIGLMALYSEVG